MYENLVCGISHIQYTVYYTVFHALKKLILHTYFLIQVDDQWQLLHSLGGHVRRG